MNEYAVLKWLHILSSTVLFGTGIGSAFFLFVSTGKRNAAVVAAVAQIVVLADLLFTATTAVLQPLTGWRLAHILGLTLDVQWLQWALWLYALAMACWLPVVWIQVRLYRIAAAAAEAGLDDLPRDYDRLFAWWTGLGFPAFFAFLAIFWLMVAKPA